MKTYVDIINIFKTLAGPGKKIKEFGNGDGDMIDLVDGVKYPYLYLETPMITRKGGSESWQFAFQVLQQTLHDSLKNRDIMQTECKQIGEAVMLWLHNKHKDIMPREFNWDVVLFERRYTDVVYGARFEFEIITVAAHSACDLIIEYENA
jgi:hypothetical protein